MEGQYVAYTFYRADPAWRRLAVEERVAHKEAFADTVDDWAARMDSLRAYSLTGVRPDCDFFLWKSAAGRLFEANEIDELLEKKQVGPLQGFRSKKGFPFAAIVKLTPELKAEFDFGNNQDADGAPAEVDFTGREPVGQCPKCKA